MKLKNAIILLTALCFLASPALSKNDKSKNKSLPPGLEKKHHQGKSLPPGWQKKLSRGDILNNDIYARGTIVIPLGKDGTISISVEGSIIKLIEKTHKIVDIIHKI